VDVPGLLSRALIASASGNYAQSLGLFDEILEVEPSNVNALIGKAVAYRRRGRPQEALNCLDLVLGVQPGNSSALLNRGTSCSSKARRKPPSRRSNGSHSSIRTTRKRGPLRGTSS